MSLAQLESLAKEAIHCNYCFETISAISRADVGYPQPRFTGRRYWVAAPRICILMTKPGAGAFRLDEGNRRFHEHLQAFANGTTTSLEAVFEHQREDIPIWGRGRLISRIAALGLSLDDIALLNVAWCATGNNEYPKPMLSGCFKRHTLRALHILRPEILLLFGGLTSAFTATISGSLPEARIVLMPDYAHRKGSVFEDSEVKRVRSIVNSRAVIKVKQI